jgi:exosortase
MSESPRSHAAAPPLSPADAFQSFRAWCVRQPLNALLLAGVVSVIVYFFGFYSVFMNGHESTALWTSRSWNSENDLEHGWLILPAAIFIIWSHRAELRDATKSPSTLGMAFIVGAIILFVLSVRTLQPRIALVAFPLLCYGITRFLWGREAARLVIFPCAFLLFTIPVGFLVSRTVGLQTLAAAFASKLSSLIGIGVVSDGATLRALDDSFHYEVAGGCSGIRSLTAMTMLAALYVHFTQRELWKKGLIFGGSLLFALIGNLVRIFTVVLFARFISPDLAAGLYHDYSGFIFFPIAVGAMVGFSNLLNRDWRSLLRLLTAKDRVPSAAANAAVERSEPGRKEPTPISYDY